ncbi:hypothetical protein ILUMI_19551, partial [Ignelater luminosus]
MKIAIIAFVLCFIVLVNAETRVQQCKQAKGDGYRQTIKVGNCRKPTCKLKKNSVVKGEFRFVPDRDAKTLTNAVNAHIAGIPFPFIGVDETDACDQIYNPDGETKHGCPLKAGEEYVYKNQFEVLALYPR